MTRLPLTAPVLGVSLLSWSLPAAAAGAAEPGAEAGASGEVSVGAGSSGSAHGSKSGKFREWMRTYPPEPHMIELGIYGGILVPSRRLELFQADDALPDQGFKRYAKVAPDIGLRVGYFPIRFFGVEAEGGAMPTKVDGGDRATMWTVRGHFVGQLGLWSITPFIVAGAGALGVASDRAAVGSEVDATIHFGGGAKAYVNRWIAVRLDVRDVIGSKQGVDEGVSNNLEVLLGISATLGRKHKEADRDGDGIPDLRDQCPDEPGKRPTGCPDRDGDGLLDHKDECPSEPGKKPTGCPDTDGDGLLDREDQCPKEPGPRPTGCPDQDGDKILDKDDKCPTEPEARNGFEDDDGCPDEVPQQLKDIAGIMKGIHFDLDKDTVTDASKPILDRAVQVLKENPNVRVEISGHTDSTGSHGHNMELSRRRAESVRQYLVDHGIDRGRLETRGAGPDQPVADNATDAGRAENRRMEFKILSQ